jgi:hypothetical protein
MINILPVAAGVMKEKVFVFSLVKTRNHFVKYKNYAVV